MLDVNKFKNVTKIINEFKKDEFNYLMIIDKFNENGIDLKRYKLEQYFFFLKKWNFIENINGRKPFILKNEIPMNMVKYMCDFTDLNEEEREQLKDKHFRIEKLRKVRLKFNI